MSSPSRMPAAQRQSVRPAAIVYPLGLWVAMAALAVANGIFRETVIIPQVGAYSGHLISTALLVVAILALSAGYFAYTTIDYVRTELLLVGMIWVLLTVGFEFLVGYLEGIPVSETVAQYDVLGGQVWIVVPLSLLVAPLLFGTYFGRT
ncbi:hypothetical protein [Natronorubrum texcoconense]|uniref:Uncharacterized protein n=1 Tax=Natronorubrum texcoconense TaxID=1095776 RepID=A0A1G8TRB1_9EURY|nr:hypothetical protein [Natronorubrum texcoconense]SDJ44061.1 hypothetical protein SAMN04515672_0571 [Natronorubrum texcoconense]